MIQSVNACSKPMSRPAFSDSNHLCRRISFSSAWNSLYKEEFLTRSFPLETSVDIWALAFCLLPICNIRGLNDKSKVVIPIYRLRTQISKRSFWSEWKFFSRKAHKVLYTLFARLKMADRRRDALAQERNPLSPFLQRIETYV